MTLTSTSNPFSILKDGKLKPGVYKIQNLYHQNYLDVEEHSRKMCCRPARDLEDGRGLWEIKNLGVGYTVRRVEPGKPDQFCNPMEGINDGTQLYVAAYPIAWRIEVVDDDEHRGFEYIRVYWGTTKRAWDLAYTTGTRVSMWMDSRPVSWRIWKLISVKAEGTLAPSKSSTETQGSGSLPPYDENAAGQTPTRAQHYGAWA